jgi:hypothetical protein
MLRKIIPLLLFANVYAVSIGVSPGHTYIDFKPNLERDFTINIHNLGNESFVADVHTLPRIKLSEGWIVTKEKSLRINPLSSEPLHVMVKFPESIPIGKHRIDIAIRARPLESKAIGVTAGVIHQVYVINPATGKDINLVSLSVNDVIKGEKAMFTLRIESVGKESCTAKGYVKIFDEHGTHLTTLLTDKKNIAPMENAELTASWDTSLVEAGDYVGIGYVEYDGKKTNELTRNFSILGSYGRIVGFEIYAGEGVDFAITFKNYFVRDVKCKASVIIKDLKGNVVDSVESREYLAPALGTRILHAYWKPEKGEYIAEATVSYNGKKTRPVERKFVVKAKLPKEIGLIAIVVIAGAIWLRKKKK